MERIRVRIVHQNKPYDGVFNGFDELVLLKLFIRVITGMDPTLPKGTFESAGVAPDFYIIDAKDFSWPLKKWLQLPDCIRKVCEDRDTKDAPKKGAKTGPVRVEETQDNDSEQADLLKNEEKQERVEHDEVLKDSSVSNGDDSPKSVRTETKAEVEVIPQNDQNIENQNKDSQDTPSSDQKSESDKVEQKPEGKPEPEIIPVPESTPVNQAHEPEPEIEQAEETESKVEDEQVPVIEPEASIEDPQKTVEEPEVPVKEQENPVEPPVEPAKSAEPTPDPETKSAEPVPVPTPAPAAKPAANKKNNKKKNKKKK